MSTYHEKHLESSRPLKEEHESLLDGMKKYSGGKDRTGASVRELLKTFERHVEK